MKVIICFISCSQQNGCERNNKFRRADLPEANEIFWSLLTKQVIMANAYSFGPTGTWLASQSKAKFSRTMLSQLLCLKVRAHKDSLTPSWSSFTLSLQETSCWKLLNYYFANLKSGETLGMHRRTFLQMIWHFGVGDWGGRGWLWISGIWFPVASSILSSTYTHLVS